MCTAVRSHSGSKDGTLMTSQYDKWPSRNAGPEGPGKASWCPDSARLQWALIRHAPTAPTRVCGMEAVEPSAEGCYEDTAGPRPVTLSRSLESPEPHCPPLRVSGRRASPCRAARSTGALFPGVSRVCISCQQRRWCLSGAVTGPGDRRCLLWQRGQVWLSSSRGNDSLWHKGRVGLLPHYKTRGCPRL